MGKPALRYNSRMRGLLIALVLLLLLPAAYASAAQPCDLSDAAQSCCRQITQGSVRGEEVESLLEAFSSNDEVFHALSRALVDYRSDREALKRRLEEVTAGVSLAKVKDGDSEG